MNRTIRLALAALSAVFLTLFVSGPASAADITAYAGADWNETPKATNGGKATFKAYGEHLLVTDLEKDGHSTIGLISIGCDSPSCNYYYWNRDGQGTTRDVDLSLGEGTHIGLKACIGDWKGSATGGIMWDKCSSTWKETSA
ncbi:hypothetical protein [Streptomyces mesophilus]|uniref:hypothetical protein n=1 Tax=Streptomyces mesophilus TaxID=1775132 RepID=UPI00332CD832